MLLVEALAALRDRTTRAQDAFDQAGGDEGGADTWQSDPFAASIEQAKAVIAWGQTASA